MTVKTANEFKPGWQPKVLAVFVREAGGEKKLYSFRVHDPDWHVDEQFNEYLISIGLPPGQYKLIEIRGLNQKFPISAISSIPMYSPFELKPNSMIYLGRVEAVVRERKDDSELRAGPVIPLIDQAVAGFSGGDVPHPGSGQLRCRPCLVSSEVPGAGEVHGGSGRRAPVEEAHGRGHEVSPGLM